MNTLQISHPAKGIFRIREEKTKEQQTLTERYGLLRVPQEEAEDGAFATENAVTLPDGRTIRFENRPEQDDEYWAEESQALNKQFEGHYLSAEPVEGRPDSPQVEVDISQIPQGDARFGLKIEVSPGERFYGLGEASRDRLELRGRSYQNWTCYQFDEIAIPLLLSGEGWGVLINASGRNFVDVCERQENAVVLLGNEDILDVFFLYGTMPQMLASYAKLTGRSMMLPAWAYGLTYIAPIHANQFEVLRHAERFRKEGIPCDMFSLEPGWIQGFYDYSTNPQWDLTKFHMPAWLYKRGRDCPDTFVSALRRMGYHLSLWFCNRYDYTDEAERVYRGDDQNAFEPWYAHLGRMTQWGIDGFKLDPSDTVMRFDPHARFANGLTQLQMHNLDQVLLTKQTWEGFAAQMNLRPMHHYCGGYLGSQRWSAATTGDNGGQHGAMVWLMTLAMSGFSNTTIDMHIFDPQSVHFGFLVPWAHLNAWEGVRQPWYAGEKMFAMFRDYAKLRYRLFPYIYTSALQAHEDGLPMVRPLPLMYPQFEDGFDNTCEYFLGDSLLVSAYCDEVSLPEGRWVDFFTGEAYQGPCRIPAKYPENRGGMLLVKGGAILPMMAQDVDCIAQYDRSRLLLDVYPDGHSEFILREDDGVSLDCETKQSCHTRIVCEETEREIVITIGMQEGNYAGRPEKRHFLVRVHNAEKEIRMVCLNPLDTAERWKR